MTEKDFKDQLKEVREQIDQNKSETLKPKKESMTFDIFKKKVVELCITDNLISKMKLQFIDGADALIIYQGVRSNIVARIKRNGNHIIYRSALKKKISKLNKQYNP